MKKKLIALLASLAMAASLTACSSTAKDESNAEPNEGTSVEEVTEGESYSVAMVTNTGGVNDQSFNQSAWEGLTSLSETYGVNVTYLESLQEADYMSNLDKMVDAGNEFVWAGGYAMADAVLTAADMNPDQMYGIIDNSFGDETPTNVVGLMFQSQEPSFMVGYAAGLTTTTDKVGFVGGITSNIIDQFEYGYRAGVAYAANELGKEIEVTVQYAESFTDAAKGKAIATSMFTDGCDIVFHAAGNVGTGVIEAAKDADKLAIGVDRDQLDVAPDNILTSALKRVDKAIELVSLEYINGSEIGGQTLVYGLSDGAVGIPEENPNMDPEVYEKTIALEDKIVDGTIVPPYDAETFTEYLGTLE